MKPIISILALAAALPAISGCGDPTPANNMTAEDVNGLGTVEQNIVTDSANQLPADVDGTSAAPASELDTPAPVARDAAEPRQKAAPPPAPRRGRPAPPPKASPPPVDPHAGHDMGNMANMSRD